MSAKKNFILICLITISLFLSGCQEEMSAEEIAATMQEKYEGIEDYSYTEYITLYANGEKATESVIQIFYKKPNFSKGIVTGGDGKGVISVIDGKFMWMYTPETNIVIKSEMPDIEGTSETDYLSMVQNYMNRSEVSLLGTEEIDGRPTYILEISSNEDFFLGCSKVKAWVDTETWMNLRSEIYNGKGNLTHKFEIQDLKVNTGIPDSEFIFEIPEGATIKDLKEMEMPKKVSLEEAEAEVSFEILFPEYLPEGYVLDSSISVHKYSQLELEGQPLESVSLQYQLENDPLFLIECIYDAETQEKLKATPRDEIAETVSINGKEGEYLEILGDMKLLKWNIGEVEFSLIGYIEKAEMLKIAESIKEKV
ncbi:MAG: DUF4367 domain-containing protein [Methanosarcinaceae archaeon]|nr:DUF4367 domain-containing protein [Methanosarcinaceae archaeon]